MSTSGCTPETSRPINVPCRHAAWRSHLPPVGRPPGQIAGSPRIDSAIFVNKCAVRGRYKVLVSH
ncbi:hypothetical protein IG631_12168 [Alternaria alternata]|nr:hypothetical protein IG631_12168 [Alternaria alternata]